MGTHSYTYIYNESGRLIVKIYLHFDGYPCGYGRKLANLLFIHQNLSMNDISDKVVAYCLRSEPNYAHVVHNRHELNMTEEWEYHIHPQSVLVIGQDVNISCNVNWKSNSFSALCYAIGYGTEPFEFKEEEEEKEQEEQEQEEQEEEQEEEEEPGAPSKEEKVHNKHDQSETK
jgi:hypothetical protein